MNKDDKKITTNIILVLLSIIIIIVIIFASLLFFLLTDFSGVKRSQYDIQEKNANPLYWINESYMYVGEGDAIKLYNVEQMSFEKIIVAPYYNLEQSYDCFSEKGAFWTTSLPTDKYQGGYDLDIKYTTNILNLTDNYLFNKSKTYVNGGLSHKSCTVGYIRQTKNKSTINYTYDELSDEFTCAGIHASYLLSESEFDVEKCNKKLNNISKYELVIAITKDNVSQYVDLGIWHYGFRIGAYYDEFTKNYIWYESEVEFIEESEKWPLRAWIISEKGTIQEEIILPKGPWVAKYSSWERFKAFSCGISCYQNYNVYKIRGEIFIHIFGKSVRDSDQGLYHLNEEKNKWEKIITGKVRREGYLISPSGCNVSYHQENNMYISSIC